MLLLRPPGVYRPQGDTALLADVLRRAGVAPGARVLDVGTGTGAVAVAAARCGAREVVAVDVAAGALLAARVNARLRRLPVRVVRGDLFAPVAREVFDVIVANPPYVAGDAVPGTARGRARAWEGGPYGRALLDRVCAQAPSHLAEGGTLLLVQSALSGVPETLAALRRAGMRPVVAARRNEPFGPVMRRRAALLEARGLLRYGQRHEELVVVRADWAGAGDARSGGRPVGAPDGRTAAAAGRSDGPPGGGPGWERRRVRAVPGGPVLVEGPVEVELEDGRVVVSDRFMVALCACRRSRAYPFCDTSHRRRARRARDTPGSAGCPSSLSD